jgi:hypothetical protein
LVFVQNHLSVGFALPLVATRPPNPQDPAYQQLERWINFAVHGALFAALNSGLWLWRGLRPESLAQLPLLSLSWGALLLLHLAWCCNKALKSA